MPSDYLQYCPWSSFDQGGRPPSPKFFYAASGQFDHIQLAPGDTIWHVSLRPLRADGRLPGELTLCGRLVVHIVTGDVGEARRRIAHYTPGYEPRPDSVHAFAREGVEDSYKELSIEALAPDLRFVSKHDRLTLAGGHVDPQQLQAMRRLTPEAAALLLARGEAHHRMTAVHGRPWG